MKASPFLSDMLRLLWYASGSSYRSYLLNEKNENRLLSICGLMHELDQQNIVSQNHIQVRDIERAVGIEPIC